MGLNIIGECRLDDILAGDFPVVTAAVTLAGGQAYPVGSVIGKATADGRGTLVDKAATDGTEAVYGILTGKVDASGGDAAGVVYLTGEYNANRLAFAAGNTWQDHADAARKLCIFFKEPTL